MSVDVNGVIAGIFGLILLYLLLRNADSLNNLIVQGGKTTVRGVAALQGR